MIKQLSIFATLAFALLALSTISHAHDMDMGSEAAALPPGGLLTATEDTTMEMGGMHLMVSAFPLQPTVPRMSDFALQATGPDGKRLEHVTFAVKFVQTEDGKDVFVTTLHSHDGQAQFSYGFNDGSEHRLEVTATQEKEDGQTTVVPPVHHEYLMDPQPQQPSIAMNARMMVQLLVIFGIGALIGRWWGGIQNAKEAKAYHAKA